MRPIRKDAHCGQAPFLNRRGPTCDAALTMRIRYLAALRTGSIVHLSVTWMVFLGAWMRPAWQSPYSCCTGSCSSDTRPQQTRPTSRVAARSPITTPRPSLGSVIEWWARSLSATGSWCARAHSTAPRGIRHGYGLARVSPALSDTGRGPFASRASGEPDHPSFRPAFTGSLPTKARQRRHPGSEATDLFLSSVEHSAEHGDCCIAAVAIGQRVACGTSLETIDASTSRSGTSPPNDGGGRTRGA